MLQLKLNSQLVHLDVIRGIAILGVFMFHIFGTIFGVDFLPFADNFRDYAKAPNLAFFILLPLRYGYLGVTLFFILSGFCIHLSFLKYISSLKEKSLDFQFNVFLKTFFVRRFFRIYPAYLLALLFFIFVYPPTRLNIVTGGGIFQFFTHLLLIQNLDKSSYYGINAAFWSIAVELQLYIIYPLFLKLRSKLNITKATLVIFIFQIFYSPLALELDQQINGIGKYVHISTNEINKFIENLEIFSYLPLNYWFTWVIGAYAAERIFYKNQKILNFQLKHKLFFLLLFLLSYEYKPLSTTIGTCSITLLLTSLIEDYILERKQVSFIEKMIANIGLVSYSIYLFHEPLLEWLKMLINKYFDANFQYGQHPYFTCTLGATIIFIPILLISWLSYKYVELPTHRLGKSISQYISFGTLVDSRIK